MGYSLQYCTNECGNAVPGNECDWEDGVCDACRERREDGAKGEPMTDWTEHDGYTLRNALRNHPELGDCALVDACARAAAHIADLEKQLKEVHTLAFSLGGKLDRATARAEALEAWAERLKDHADARERMLAAVQRMCDERESRIVTLEAEQPSPPSSDEGACQSEVMYLGSEVYWLRKHVATLEAERADAIPRAAIVTALRKRLRQATAPGGASCSSDMRRDAIAETLRGLIREIERGEWPKEGER